MLHNRLSCVVANLHTFCYLIFLFNNVYEFLSRRFRKNREFVQMHFCNLTFQKQDTIRNISFKSQMFRFQISSYLFVCLFVCFNVQSAFNILMGGLEEGLRCSVELYFNSWIGVLHF